MSRSEHIGISGQKAFSLLCSEAGLICNEALEDRAGWDFFVQFPLDENYTGPLDNRPSALCSFFQVKASANEKKRVEVRLSNAERMATEVKPTFFALARQQKGSSRFTFTLGHIGEDAIAYILQALRKTSNRNIRATNRKKISIPISALELNVVRRPCDIVHIIQKHCPKGLQNYIDEKFERLKTVGYGTHPYSAEFSVEGDNADDRLVALMIGEIEKLEVKDFQIEETRFGVRSTKHTSSFATLSVEPCEPSKVAIVFRNSEFPSDAEFECSIRTPGIPGLDKTKFRARLYNEMFSFSFGFSEDVIDWKFHEQNDKSKPWDKLRNEVIFLNMVAVGGCEIRCYENGRQFAFGRLRTEVSSIGQLEDFIASFKAIDYLCRFLEVRHILNSSAYEFYFFTKHNRFISQLIGRWKESSMLIQSTLDELPKTDYSFGRFVFPMIFRCNGVIASILIVVEGQVTANGRNVKLSPSNVYPWQCKTTLKRAAGIRFLRESTQQLFESLPETDLLVVDKRIRPPRSEKKLAGPSAKP